ncbi:uncharacterized protein N0V89_001546 [Didymosphaeria variabile]|uniref:Uncharacterized protein n=1 Tax=Didymosphaeria variabile TaxID=1932322 RepID=A0A9W9CGU4_9PLEO|nr:uncharacterized protein N0V89_001546 [Didymosphaeria variabile]KAJ4360977.1 hypothetical protein N0V89_001546 [Didymosphaeria variabile]
MRATDLLIAIGATLGFASADVVCNTEALHHAAQVIADTANKGFEKSVKALCSSRIVEGIAEIQSGSIILGLNRTCSDCNSNDCAQQFDSIIKECVTGQELGGGIAITDGITVEVSIDTSLSEASKSKALDARRVRKAKTRTKHKTKAKKAKKTKSRTKPKKTKTKPRPKKTKTKPKETKSKACPIKNKKTHGKKGSKHGLRSLIPTLFPRTGSRQSSSDECGDFDENMHTPAGWGETYFGFTEDGTMTPKKLASLAKKAWEQAHNKRPTKLLLVAALYVPKHGVYFGTIPHKGGEDKFKADCARFTALWDRFLKERKFGSASASQQLYHAEDAAMLYAFEKGAFGHGPEFPPGSMMVTYGEKNARGTPPQHVATCSVGNTNITPNCNQVLRYMGVKEG